MAPTSFIQSRKSSCSPATLQAPHLDRVAKDGMFFPRAYAHPVCRPSRADITAGQIQEEPRSSLDFRCARENRGALRSNVADFSKPGAAGLDLKPVGIPGGSMGDPREIDRVLVAKHVELLQTSSGRENTYFRHPATFTRRHYNGARSADRCHVPPNGRFRPSFCARSCARQRVVRARWLGGLARACRYRDGPRH